MKDFILVFVGGGFGSIARFGISILFKNIYHQYNAVAATFTSNLLSCIALAVVVWAISSGKLDANMRYLLIIGFCGGLSTFSTFSFETMHLIRQGLWAWAVLNVLISVAACLAVLGFLSKNIDYSLPN